MEKNGNEDRMMHLVDDKKFGVEEHWIARTRKADMKLEILWFFFFFCYAKGVSTTAL